MKCKRNGYNSFQTADSATTPLHHNKRNNEGDTWNDMEPNDRWIDVEDNTVIWEYLIKLIIDESIGARFFILVTNNDKDSSALHIIDWKSNEIREVVIRDWFTLAGKYQ